MVQKKINLCFVFPDGDGWTGETNYLISLISSLNYLKNKNFNFFVFCSHNKKKLLSKFVNKKNIVSSDIFKKGSIKEKIWKLSKFLFKKDFFLNYFFRKYNINIISHYLPMKKLPSICWIPDLQHLYLKKFFSKKEIKRRDELFQNYLNNSRSIILSSNDTYNQLKKNYKVSNIKTYILNFIPYLNFDRIKNFEYLKKIYNIKKNFIYIPNQFWKHKNHSILIDCAKILKKKNYPVKFVITGNPSLNSFNSIYSNFVNKIQKYGLTEYFHLLGFVPYSHVVNLIYHSKILINPSLFEGWSTTVEEGKILKKKMILSSIKVHKDQAKSVAVFFNPKNAVDLSKKIIQLNKIKIEKTNLNKLKKIFLNKRILFAQKYLSIIKKSL